VQVVDPPVRVADQHYTVHTQRGLDPDDVRLSSGGRPISAVDDGSLIEEL
jgi:hypothetical protein